MLLYPQLQEGFNHTLMKAPSISDVRDYSELCVAARNVQTFLTRSPTDLQHLCCKL